MTDWTDFFTIAGGTLAIDSIIFLLGYELYRFSKEDGKENARVWLWGAAIIATPITFCGFLFALLVSIGAL